MLLGRSQAVPDGREEETHPMGRFFTVFSEASGICHWQRQYRGQCSDPACLPPYSCYGLTSYRFRRSFIKFLFLDAHLDSRSQWHSFSGR